MWDLIISGNNVGSRNRWRSRYKRKSNDTQGTQGQAGPRAKGQGKVQGS